MAETRTCEHCGVRFTPRREHARFCSARCRVAWNGESTSDPAAEERALVWSITAMRDIYGRLLTARAWDQPRAFAAISEAVWWITIVDGTLVRYHPEAYDAVMADRLPGERNLIEGSLAGLRFVRNQMSHDGGQGDFIQQRAIQRDADDGSVIAWRWTSMPEPVLAALSPRGQAWEMARYRAYQAHLAGHAVGDTFGLAVPFLQLVATKAAPAMRAGDYAATWPAPAI
jgi:hypothetical protein